MIKEKTFTGAIPKKLDLRDLKIGFASAPFDWATGYDLEGVINATSDKKSTFPVKDQNGSYSCGGQAGSYLEQALYLLEKGRVEEKSARDIYSQIYYPGGGTTMRDIFNTITKKGVASESDVTSYENGNPPSENFMRTKGSVSTYPLGQGYAFTGTDIDSVASAIRDNHGAILLIWGADNGTWRSQFPIPSSKVWAHFVWAAKAKLINNKKYIGIRNSWGDVGDHGWQWLPEEYFQNGFVGECGVIYQNSEYLTKKTELSKALLSLLQRLITLLFGPSKI